MSKLSPKQSAFVGQYLIDLNATQAAIRAGYSHRNADKIGSQLLGKTRVSEAIQVAMKERGKRTEINQDYVLQTIYETVERCRQAEQVFDRSGEAVLVETPSGELAPAFIFDAKNVLKGCELLGKHLGMFTGKQGDDEAPPPTNVEIIVKDARRQDTN